MLAGVGKSLMADLYLSRGATRFSEAETSELRLLPAKLELLGVEDNAGFAARAEEVDGAPPVSLKVVVPKDGVVDAPFLVDEVGQHGIELPIVSVTGPH